MANFPTEFLFQRLPDFWSFFEDREDVKNAWDAYLGKSQALDSLLRQADLSKSLSTIPLLDRNSHEYFVFSKLVRRTDRETLSPFWSFEVDSSILFVQDLNEKIDDTLANRVLTPPTFYEVVRGSGADEGKAFLDFRRGAAPTVIGETFWTRGSDVVTGTGFEGRLAVGDIAQGQDKNFYRVTALGSGQFTIQGPTVFDENLGPGDGVTVIFQLAATADVIPGSVKIYFDGIAVDASFFAATASGQVTFSTAPSATVSSITADYHRGYVSPSATNRRTVREKMPDRLFSRGVYRDRRSIFTNFGTAIGLDRPTSLPYLNQVRGIYFARYNGPSTANMSLGSGILIDLPFSERAKVRKVISVDPKSVITEFAAHPVPPPLSIQVASGESLPRDFNLLTDGVRTADFINDPDLFALEPLKSDPERYFTFMVIVKGLYATHVAVQTGKPIDYELLRRFKRDIRPSYTNCWVLTDVDFLAESANFFLGAVNVTNAFDAASTLEFNYLNYAVIDGYLAQNGFADEAALAASSAAIMDNDSVGLVEQIEQIVDSVGVSTLENNLVNFGIVSPDAMDDSTVPLLEGLLIQESVSGSPGATLYSF